MRALFISDKKPEEPLLKLTENCDIVILLGDLFYEWIKELKDINIPIIGVTGNHDFDTHMNHNLSDPIEKIGATKIHLNIFTYKGIRFTGFCGDLSYIFAENNTPYWKGENSEALRNELKKMEMLEGADVLLTHFPSIGTLDMPHILGRRGLQTFRDYIDRVKPKYHFHGHMHQQLTGRINETEVNCVFPYLIKEL
ncbi:MAG: hypothetical protein UT02_C0002G0031 [Parcubacteria group bacterium GW2011_GWC2_38_7]|nr:MAG: hypothetical protein UT02_C0002G0031 [Parcubacteria group bacterium GW2011_GWC2_38_7]